MTGITQGTPGKTPRLLGYATGKIGCYPPRLAYMHGINANSRALLLTSAQVKEILPGDEDSDTLTSIDELTLTYMDQGRWREAAELGKQVIEIRERVLGNEHPSTLTSMDKLALTYANRRQWREAEELDKY